MSSSYAAPAGDEHPLHHLLSITHDILQARDVDPAAQSIARGFAQAFHWRYVTIVAAEVPGGPLRRCALFGYSPDVASAHVGEIIPPSEIAETLLPAHEVVPNCYYVLAEDGHDTAHNIYAGDLPRDAPRAAPNLWHERDLLVLVLTDRDGDMMGYLSCDHPLDGKTPSRDVLREMQVFVNLLGLALANAQAHQAEIGRRRIVEEYVQLQNDFLGTVAHEVRSPLAAIRGASETLLEHGDHMNPHRRRELLTVLERSTSRLSTIFEDFLLLSRMDGGSLTLQMEFVDPIAVAEESVARLDSEHPERGITTRYVAPLSRVHADEGRVVQVLTNLLSNAVRYSRHASVITLVVEAGGDDVYFTVTNEGDGIVAEQRDRIFTRFGRLAADEGSTGLGLYICKELVTKMGGRIGFESTPGLRTSFWFTLPRAEEAPSLLGA